jgi:hypothetical protein
MRTVNLTDEKKSFTLVAFATTEWNFRRSTVLPGRGAFPRAEFDHAYASGIILQAKLDEIEARAQANILTIQLYLLPRRD